MAKIGRRDLALLLLGVGQDEQSPGEVRGMTRLQKLIFLLEREGHVKASGDGFTFVPYKAGPYSRQLYDDLELLENLGLIDSEYVADATDAEAEQLEELSFEDLVEENSEAADAFAEKKYRLTALGRKQMAKLLESGDYQPVVDAIRKVKSKFGHHSLNDLLYYVYTKYPDMTVESEIRDKVLRGRLR